MFNKDEIEKRKDSILSTAMSADTQEADGFYWIYTVLGKCISICIIKAHLQMYKFLDLKSHMLASLLILIQANYDLTSLNAHIYFS